MFAHGLPMSALAWSIPDWFSVVGLPLALAGLFIAWREVQKTKTPAEAARDAVADTQRHLADNHLLLLIPRLLQAGREVEHAVRRPDRDSAQKELAAWRELAVQVRTL